MRKIVVIFSILIGTLFLSLGVLYVLGYLKPPLASLSVETKPGSKVIINGSEVGKTPYETTSSQDEIVLRLIPEGKEDLFFEKKIKLSSGVATVVRWEWGEAELASAGEILSFEKTESDAVGFALVSVPDAVEIEVDGVIRGFSPYKTTALSFGEHAVRVSSPKYEDRTFRIKLVKGYKLTSDVKLALKGSPEDENKKDVPPEVFVEILTTPTGFLNVRRSPGSLSQSLGQAKPGEKYPFLEEDEKGQWFKITFKDKEGWVSAQYAKKV